MKTTKWRRALRAGLSYSYTTRPWLVGCIAAMALCCNALGQDEGTKGRWDAPDPSCGYAPYQWVTQAVHAIHLPSDEVLFWQFGESTNRVWTASSGCFTAIPTPDPLFCSGHVALPNGSILVAGGRGEGVLGVDQTWIYQLGGGGPGGPWKLVQPMNHARWYPSVTALPNGTVLAISGKDADSDIVGFPEIYDPATNVWTDLGLWSHKEIPVYPFMFVLPGDGNTRVFYAGSVGGYPNNDGTTFVLDVQMEYWSLAIDSIATEEGAAVMYEAGRILKSGGVNMDTGLVTKVTQMIDLSDPASPLPDSWDTDPTNWDMQKAREHHNLVLLADGTILAVGGANPNPVMEAERFDPNALDPKWVIMAAMEKPRVGGTQRRCSCPMRQY